MEEAKAGPGARGGGGLAFAGGIGALAGTSLAARGRGRSRALGAVVGALVLVGSEGIARRRQRPGEIPPLWHRIITSAALAAPLGWIAGHVTRARPVRFGCPQRVRPLGRTVR